MNHSAYAVREEAHHEQGEMSGRRKMTDPLPV